MIEEKFKNIQEILDLNREELAFDNLDAHAILDLEDLKELEELYIAYQQEKEKNKQLEEVIDLMAEDLWKTDDYFTCKDIKMKEDCYADTLADGNACGGNCIKKYYFKKAGDRS